MELTEPKERNTVELQNQTVSKKLSPCLITVCLSVHLLPSISFEVLLLSWWQGLCHLCFTCYSFSYW